MTSAALIERRIEGLKNRLREAEKKIQRYELEKEISVHEAEISRLRKELELLGS